jgi:hypothetical protein
MNAWTVREAAYAEARREFDAVRIPADAAMKNVIRITEEFYSETITPAREAFYAACRKAEQDYRDAGKLAETAAPTIDWEAYENTKIALVKEARDKEGGIWKL